MKTLIVVVFASLLCVWAYTLFLLISSGQAPSPATEKPAPSLPLWVETSHKERRDHSRPAPKEEYTAAAGRSLLQLPVRSAAQDKPQFKPAPPIDVILKNLTFYLHAIHDRLQKEAGAKATAERIWDAYFEVTRDTIWAWEQAHREEFPSPRQDDSIYVSLATYRDEYCLQTIETLYSQAAHPEKVFVGMVQQNCYERCRSGVLKGGKVEDVPPDQDCYEEFCATEQGQKVCKDQVVLLRVNESESLGPMVARYFTSKLYRGETYYLQVDSHSIFDTNWDTELIKMLHNAPSNKPVITGYPPPPEWNWKGSIGFRMCDPLFANSDIEWQIVRLDAAGLMDKTYSDIPRYAPFVAAGFLFAQGQLLYDVPFDPLLPWVFMGEEISISLRLWTTGYDLFSPTKNVLAHYYVRRHTPKFWESVNRLFKKPIHNQITSIVLKRVKHLLGYPESITELVTPESVLYGIDRYSCGRERPKSGYWKLAGVDVVNKQIVKPLWCHEGRIPEVYAELGLPTSKSKS